MSVCRKVSAAQARTSAPATATATVRRAPGRSMTQASSPATSATTPISAVYCQWSATSE